MSFEDWVAALEVRLIRSLGTFDAIDNFEAILERKRTVTACFFGVYNCFQGKHSRWYAHVPMSVDVGNVKIHPA